MTINIAYVIDTIETPNAGTEKQLLMLMENLDRKQFSPHLICLRSSRWLKNSKLHFPVFIVNLHSFSPLAAVSALKKFRKYCVENNVAVVQTFFKDANVFGTLAAYLSSVKIVISSRKNYGLGYWHNRYWIAILRALRHITPYYIANSKVTADYTVKQEKICQHNIFVIYNGVNLGPFEKVGVDQRQAFRRSLGIKPNHILIGTIANLRPVKNLDLFIRVAALTHRKYPFTRFVLVGEGPERPRLEQMIKDASLDGTVTLIGQRDDILPILISLDIGVLCSKSESLSNAIIEYMAAGLPCVVSEVGGNLEAIGYKHGLSFENDNEEDFYTKLERLILDGNLRMNLGKAAKEYAFATYGHSHFVKAHQSLYEKFYRVRY